MKFLSALVPFLCATVVTSFSLSVSYEGGKQKALATDGETIDVPGKNPLTVSKIHPTACSSLRKAPLIPPRQYCADPKDYILTIDSVDLDPNPPTPGANLTIVASGTFSKDVEAGAKVFLQVKYGLITLIKQEADLCDQLGNVDLTCPLKKGPMELTKSVQIPKQVPKGMYTVLADVYTNEGEKVTCLQATVHF